MKWIVVTLMYLPTISASKILQPKYKVVSNKSEDGFGYDIAAVYGELVIGAPYDNNKGSVMVGPNKHIYPPRASTNIRFGEAVAVND